MTPTLRALIQLGERLRRGEADAVPEPMRLSACDRSALYAVLADMARQDAMGPLDLTRLYENEAAFAEDAAGEAADAWAEWLEMQPKEHAA